MQIVKSSSSVAQARVIAPRASRVRSRPATLASRAVRLALRAQPQEAVETVANDAQDDKNQDDAAKDGQQEQKSSDPLEIYCDDNPEADECRVYED
ncbi:g7745 [Coccomyxa elongata]